MFNNLAQPKGSTSKEPNKQAIARVFGLKQSDIAYISVGADLSGYTMLYEKSSQLPFYVGNATGTIISWEVIDSNLKLTTSNGVFNSSNAHTLKLGYVKSYEELKAIVPTRAGQIIELESFYDDWEAVGWLGPRGGGKFIVVAGSATEDGGFVCQPTNTTAFHLQRMTDTLNLFDFGVKVSTRNTNTLYETSTQLQNAINSAVLNKLPLRSSLYASRSGYAQGQALYLTKGIDITGIKTMKGIYAIIYRSSLLEGVFPTFDDDPMHAGYVVLNMNCTWGTNGKIFGTSDGNQQLGVITTYNMDGRNAASPMNGQLHCFSATYAEAIISIHNYGYGVRFADAYDSNIEDARSLFSGLCDPVAGIEKYGLAFGSYTLADSTSRVDECNALTIHNAVAHNCYDLAWYLSGSKCNLVRVHEEATYVTTTVRNNPNSNSNLNGFGYCNSYFASIGGTLGAISCDADSSNTLPHVFTAVGWDCHVGSFVGQSLGCSAGYAPLGGHLGTVRCTGDLRMVGNSRTAISHASVGGSVTISDDHCAIESGNITGSLTLSGSSRVNRLSVAGDTLVTNLAPSIDSCSLNTLTLTGGQAKVNNCTITGAVNIGAEAYLNNCRVGTADVTITLGDVFIANTRFSGKVTSTINTLQMSNSKVGGDFTGGGRLSNVVVNGALYTSSNLTAWLDAVSVAGTLNITGSNVSIYIQGGSANRMTFDAAVTGLWQIFPVMSVTIAVDNWKVPTTVTGLGRMTINPVTNTIYRLSSGAWASYTTA